MPEAPTYQVQGSTELAKGDRAALQQATKQAQEQDFASVQNEPTPVLGTGVDFGPLYASNTSDEMDQVLFSPTDFPERPLTYGAPFGPGADFTPRPHEEQSDFMKRIAKRAIQGGPAVPDAAISWAVRTLVGE